LRAKKEEAGEPKKKKQVNCHRPGPFCLSLASVTASLLFLLSGAVRGDIPYRIQPIIKLGDKIGDLESKPAGGDLEIGMLNDHGQLVFVTENKAGGEMLIQYADGKFTPIAAAGLSGPNGPWPQGLFFFSATTMNQQGNVVFTTGVETETQPTTYGIYQWDAQGHKITPLVRKGMSAGSGLTFDEFFGIPSVINNTNEITFTAQLKNSTGPVQGSGVFFRGADGVIQTVVLPGQKLPDGGIVTDAGFAQLNDAGRVAFLATTKQTGTPGAYVWDGSTITPVAVVGTAVTDGTKIAGVGGVSINSKTGDVLVFAHTKANASDGLYLWSDGRLMPLLVTGQDMPGGGKIQDLPAYTSYPNELGQRAFVARITEAGATRSAAYLLDTDSKISLILKSGTPTDLGTVTEVSVLADVPPSLGLALNAAGQVAVTVKIDNGSATLVLLTPNGTAPGG
jgi:hypothetical protein